MRVNRRANIRRPDNTLSTLNSTAALETIYADVPIWFRKSTSMVITIDGEETASEAELRLKPAYSVQRGDVVEVLPESTDMKYRIEAVDELLSPSGKVAGYQAFLVRDSSLE